jgi:hypothetical protein
MSRNFWIVLQNLSAQQNKSNETNHTESPGEKGGRLINTPLVVLVVLSHPVTQFSLTT